MGFSTPMRAHSIWGVCSAGFYEEGVARMGVPLRKAHRYSEGYMCVLDA